MCLKLEVIKQRIQMYCLSFLLFLSLPSFCSVFLAMFQSLGVGLRYELIVEYNFWKKWLCCLRIRCALEGSVVSVLANIPVFALDIRDKNRRWSVKYSCFQKRPKVYLGKLHHFDGTVDIQVLCKKTWFPRNGVTI